MNKGKTKIYGLELVLELFSCDLKILASGKKIKTFIDQICKLIKIKKYGPSYIKRFMGGDSFGEGYSFFQFITSSSIAGHCIEADRVVFINIFSCNLFDYKKAIGFAQKFFRAKRAKKKIIIH